MAKIRYTYGQLMGVDAFWKFDTYKEVSGGMLIAFGVAIAKLQKYGAQYNRVSTCSDIA